MRFLPVGPRTFLVERADLEATLALFDALLADPVEGVVDIIPAARTLMVRVAPGGAADGRLAADILARLPAPGTTREAGQVETIEIPMTYDGADLDEVAAHMGLSVADVIAAHQATTWQVAFCGFAPGFAYMTCDDPRFDLPRRPAPRTAIPAGSVALAGRFCGVYPQETPGGWQLLGTTHVPMWDLDRTPPALLRPGVRARFVAYPAAPSPSPIVRHENAVTEGGLNIISTAFPILFQDEGRPDQSGLGVSSSGALDRGAFHRANRAVGNPAGTPALEVMLGPVRLKAREALTLCVTGAAEKIEIRAHGVTLPVVPGSAFALDGGDEVLIHPPTHGMRSYLAIRGGFVISLVLGSAATDTLACIGPAPLKDGAIVGAAHACAGAVGIPEISPPLPDATACVELPVTMGPRTDWFPPEMVALFLSQEWRVTPQSSRIGIRLHGAKPLMRPDTTELPSEGTETGAIQVPHSGQPVLFLADHPLTGGYPVIATLLPEALDMAGQLPPGARIRFTATHPFAPITASRPA